MKGKENERGEPGEPIPDTKEGCKVDQPQWEGMEAPREKGPLFEPLEAPEEEIVGNSPTSHQMAI